jgi:integrase
MASVLGACGNEWAQIVGLAGMLQSASGPRRTRPLRRHPPCAMIDKTTRPRPHGDRFRDRDLVLRDSGLELVEHRHCLELRNRPNLLGGRSGPASLDPPIVEPGPILNIDAFGFCVYGPFHFGAATPWLPGQCCAREAQDCGPSTAGSVGSDLSTSSTQPRPSTGLGHIGVPLNLAPALAPRVSSCPDSNRPEWADPNAFRETKDSGASLRPRRAPITRERVAKWHSRLAASPRNVRGKAGKPARPLGDADGQDEIRRRRASTNRVLTILKAALNQSFRDGKVAPGTAWRAVKPFGEVEAARVRYFTRDEVRRLVNAAQGSFRILVNAALFTGARYGELGRLRIGDFNPDSGTVFIGQSKSGKSRHIVLTEEGQRFFTQITTGRATDELMLRHDDGSVSRAAHRPRSASLAARQVSLAPRRRQTAGSARVPAARRGQLTVRRPDPPRGPIVVSMTLRVGSGKRRLPGANARRATRSISKSTRWPATRRGSWRWGGGLDDGRRAVSNLTSIERSLGLKAALHTL